MISFVNLLKISMALIWEPSRVHAHQFLIKMELTITFVYRSNENIACGFWRWDGNSWAAMNKAIDTTINMHYFPRFWFKFVSTHYFLFKKALTTHLEWALLTYFQSYQLQFWLITLWLVCQCWESKTKIVLYYVEQNVHILWCPFFLLKCIILTVFEFW